jgi:hypothetical protein
MMYLVSECIRNVPDMIFFDSLEPNRSVLIELYVWRVIFEVPF